jgi:DNA replication protein DnaC
LCQESPAKEILKAKLREGLKVTYTQTPPSTFAWFLSFFYTPKIQLQKTITFTLPYRKNFKCIFLGKGGVGKTSLIERLVSNTFNRPSE